MSKEAKIRKEEEYEMQLLGFTSRAVNSTLQRTVEETIHLGCKKLGESLEKTYKLDEKGSLTLKQDVESLLKSYLSHSCPHLAVLKEGVKKLVSIPDNVLLDEDKDQEIKFSRAEVDDMKENLQRLKMRAKQATVLSAILEEERLLMNEFDSLENVVETITAATENILINPDIDYKLIECVQNCRVVDNITKNSSNVNEINYTDNVSNHHCIKELDLGKLLTQL